METQFIFVRHGEPRYDEVQSKWNKYVGYELAQLSENGEAQAEMCAKNELFDGADLIVSSPYTRALQTAAIISRVTGLKLTVEHDFHEWLPDTDFRYEYDGNKAFEVYLQNHGVQRMDSIYRYESYDDLKKRVELALLKYKKYKKVIVVCHGIVMSAVTHYDDVIEHCGIREVFI